MEAGEERQDGLDDRGEEQHGLHADLDTEVHQEVRAVPEHTVCAAHEGCGAEGRTGVSAAVYDGGDVVSFMMIAKINIYLLTQEE